MEGERIRVLLVDHHALVRQCLALLLERDNPRLEVIVQAGSLAEGRARVNAGGVDVAVIRLDLPDGDGTDLVHELHETHPPVPALVLTTAFDTAWQTRALEADAEEVLTTAASVEEFIGAVGRLGGR
jgi:DNA-binding NarL/FixJ family response regulator